MKVLQNTSLLLLRFVLAYGFYEPAKTKWQDISSVAEWFDSLNIPFPVMNAYLSASFEMLGVVLLVLGLFTRLISVPLMIIMLVAIVTVHWENGFNAANNGFEIPLYYLIMLLTLCAYGSGDWSADKWVKKKFSKLQRML